MYPIVRSVGGGGSVAEIHRQSCRAGTLTFPTVPLVLKVSWVWNGGSS